MININNPNYFIVDQLNTRSFLQLILYCVAPTIFAEKPATLVSFNNNRYQSKFFWDKFHNQIFENCCYKLESVEIRRTPTFVSVLFFRQDILETIFKEDDKLETLKSFNQQYSIELKQNLGVIKEQFLADQFPHEVGIFLGIPAKDVISYIENKGKNYLFNGYWKVYHYPWKTKKVFDSFDQAQKKMSEVIQKSFYTRADYNS